MVWLLDSIWESFPTGILKSARVMLEALELVQNLKRYAVSIKLYIHSKHYKTRGLPIFSGGIKRNQWHEMD